VAPEQSLGVVLDQPVAGLPDGPGVWCRQGERGVATLLEATPEARVFRLTAVEGWPSGTLTVSLRDGWFAADGRPLSVDTSSRSITVEAAPVDRRVGWRGPEPPAPSNLSTVVIHAAPAFDEAPVVRAAGRPAERLQHRAGETVVGLPDTCPPVCPGADLVLQVGDANELRLRVGTRPDTARPQIRLREVRPEGSAVVAEWTSDEPVWARLELDGRATEPEATLLGHRGLRFRWSGLAPGPHRVSGWFEDLAGHRTPISPLTFEAPERLRIAVTEVVTTPLRDWGDSEPAGLPFDAWPGGGTVSETDEWVELVNRGDRAIDLTAVPVEVRAVDATPSITVVRGAPGLYFGSGGTLEAWGPGEALVVRLRGNMASRDLGIEVWVGEEPLDAIAIGEGGVADGGAPPDPVHEALAWAGDAWRWCRPTPGDPRPALQCR
jgi:hypothetical protein